MFDNVTAFIAHHQLLPEDGTLIVGVSGGADSLCLLHLLSRLCGPGKFYPRVQLHAAHLNHQLRGSESKEDARVVARLMAQWQIPCTLGEIDVPALARREKRSLEDAARVARYRFLREVAVGQPIAVAHHANDQAETILLHWLRGSGLRGLVGMLPRQQDIIRPLLEVTRAEIVGYCQREKITPLEDYSNTDPHFLRNRVRHELLPLLQELNPTIQRTLLRNAEVARVDMEWLEEQVDSQWSSVVVVEQVNSSTLDVHALQALPLSLRRHLLRRVTARLCEGQSPLETRHFSVIEQLLSARHDRKERALHLPRRLRALHTMNRLTIERLPGTARAVTLAPPNVGNVEITLRIPGEVTVSGTPWKIRADTLAESIQARVLRALHANNWPEVWQLLPVAQHMVYADGEQLGAHPCVRTWRPGDRMRPLGMQSEKKVQDIFVDRHIRRAERMSTPFVCSATHSIWLAGICLDDRVRLSSKTQQIICFSLNRREDEGEPR